MDSHASANARANALGLILLPLGLVALIPAPPVVYAAAAVAGTIVGIAWTVRALGTLRPHSSR